MHIFMGVLAPHDRAFSLKLTRVGEMELTFHLRGLLPGFTYLCNTVVHASHQRSDFMGLKVWNEEQAVYRLIIMVWDAHKALPSSEALVAKRDVTVHRSCESDAATCGPRRRLGQTARDECVPGAFTITVLTMNRVASLLRLLRSLEASDYNQDPVSLVIKIDYSEEHAAVMDVASQFKFTHGPKTVHVSQENIGLRQAWLQAWRPQDQCARGIILEDDVELAPAWYLWLNNAWDAYRIRDDLMGISLSRQTQKMMNLSHFGQDSAHYGYEIVNDHEPFLWKCVGSWGFSPHPIQQGRERSMWTQYMHYFVTYVEPDLHFLYLNLPQNRTIAAHYREAGEHYQGGLGVDFQLAQKVDMNFPSALKRYGWDHLEGEEEVQHGLHGDNFPKSSSFFLSLTRRFAKFSPHHPLHGVNHPLVSIQIGRNPLVATGAGKDMSVELTFDLIGLLPGFTYDVLVHELDQNGKWRTSHPIVVTVVVSMDDDGRTGEGTRAQRVTVPLLLDVQNAAQDRFRFLIVVCDVYEVHPSCREALVAQREVTASISFEGHATQDVAVSGSSEQQGATESMSIAQRDAAVSTLHIYVLSRDSRQGAPGASSKTAGRLDTFQKRWRSMCRDQVEFTVCPGVVDARRGYGATRAFVNCFVRAV